MDRRATDRAAEAARLAAIRRRVEALDGAGWLLSADGDTTMLDARGRDGSLVTIARFEACAAPEEIELAAAALDDLRFMLDLVGRAIVALRPRPAAAADMGRRAERLPDHTTEAAMLCADPAFRRFLMDCHGLESPATDERVAQKVRSLLGVTSRREINQTDGARAGWIALRDSFRAWKRRAA